MYTAAQGQWGLGDSVLNPDWFVMAGLSPSPPTPSSLETSENPNAQKKNPDGYAEEVDRLRETLTAWHCSESNARTRKIVIASDTGLTPEQVFFLAGLFGLN